MGIPFQKGRQAASELVRGERATLGAGGSLESAGGGVGGLSNSKLYFPELDGLRFLAFFLIYLFHNGVPQWQGWVSGTIRLLEGWGLELGLPRDLGYRFQSNGWTGVQLFFVLSGFLITTLLLREESRFGRIDLKAFWVRRLLRIWPLYYATLLVVVGLLPWADGQFGTTGFVEFIREQLAAFLLYLGNWSMAYRGAPPNDGISVLWSVCVEEQFYLFCPLLVLLVPKRARLVVVMLLMGVGIGARADLAARNAGPLLFQFSTMTHLDTLLSGVALAIVYSARPGWFRAGSTSAGVAQGLVVMAIVLLLCFPDLGRKSVARQTWDYVWLWGLTVLLLASVIGRRGWLTAVLRYPRLVWLGKVSYGLYMLHEVSFWLSDRISGRLGWYPNKEILETIMTLGLTVGLAGLSYYGLERPFLRLKEGWTRVPSRPV